MTIYFLFIFQPILVVDPVPSTFEPILGIIVRNKENDEIKETRKKIQKKKKNTLRVCLDKKILNYEKF